MRTEITGFACIPQVMLDTGLRTQPQTLRTVFYALGTQTARSTRP